MKILWRVLIFLAWAMLVLYLALIQIEVSEIEVSIENAQGATQELIQGFVSSNSTLENDLEATLKKFREIEALTE